MTNLTDLMVEDVEEFEELDNSTQNATKRIMPFTFRNEEEDCLEIPNWCCSICCRVLYYEEVYTMDMAVEKELSHFLKLKSWTWPVLMYPLLDENGDPIRDAQGDSTRSLMRKNTETKNRRGKNRPQIRTSDVGLIAVCASHKSSGNNSVRNLKELIEVLNTQWCYPGDIPQELQNLHSHAEYFLSPVLVFCELTNRLSSASRATRAGYHFVNGRIGLYYSSSYIGDYVGTRGMIKEPEGTQSKYTREDLLRIEDASVWLRENNRVFRDRAQIRSGSAVIIPEIPEVIRTFQQEVRVDINTSSFQEDLMMPVYQGGPRTADEENTFENIVVGVDDNRELVKYGNPRLMGYLFPFLYVGGKGFYSLDYSKISASEARVINVHEAFTDRDINSDLENDIEEGGEIDFEEGDGLDDRNDGNEDDDAGERGYSRTTLKAYAKFRLLSVDRRFGTSIKYIFMLFDWAQKKAVFGFHNRRHRSMRDRKKTTAHDVLERSSLHSGYRYNQSTTVSIPSSIRTGVTYKQELFCRFSALFDKFGTPQLFGTYTCNDQEDGQISVARYFHGDGASTHKDPVLFVNHWKRNWHSFFTFLRKVWAPRKVGGLKAHCWVLEVQSRGTPHTHFCLWTEWSIERLISDNIISCSSIGADQEQTDLIMKHQVHGCGSYCESEYRDGCRFGFPYSPSDRKTYFDIEKKRFVYQRGVGDSRINGYNLDLLRFGRVNMDLQYNRGSEVKRYMCKYITKQAVIKKATIAQDRNQSMDKSHIVSDAYVQNFHYRSVSVTEAIMDLCGWDMSGVSHSVVYLATDLPEKRQPLLKRAFEIASLPKNSTDVFMSSKWERYLERPKNIQDPNDPRNAVNFERMTYKKYYEQFNYVTVQNRMRMFKDERRPRGRDVCQRRDQAITRTRTLNVTKSEDAFMHLLMLHWPVRKDIDKWFTIENHCSTFQALAVSKLGRRKILSLAPGLLVVIDFGTLPQVPAEPDSLLDKILLTVDQQTIYDEIKRRLLDHNEACRVLVTGAAGTGKSILLKIVSEFSRRNGYHPVVLAPSGVAAVNVRGETIHRWFRFSRMGNGSYFVGNQYSVREQLVDIVVKGLRPLLLVDEVSMISGTLLSSMERTLSGATHITGQVFGGIAMVFFGDFGQLGPINRSQKAIDWFWKSEFYKEFTRFDLITSCRQNTDKGFKKFLDGVRKGHLSRSNFKVLVDIAGNGGQGTGGIPPEAIKLMTHRWQVETINKKCLDSLSGELWTSFAQDDGGYIKDQSISGNIASETGLLSILHLKVGAMVMCTSNIDVAHGLVNGTVGKVMCIHEGDIIEIETVQGQRFRVGKEYRTTGRGNHERYQLPLLLSWAITIHKAQSLTLGKVAVALKSIFSTGQAYVALSRVRSRADLFILDLDLKKMLKVAHAVKVRLTKEDEEGVGIEDEVLEAIEDEIDEEGVENALKNLRESKGIVDFGDNDESTNL